MELLRKSVLLKKYNISMPALNASICVGIVIFFVSLWGIPSLTRLFISTVFGVMACLMTLTMFSTYRNVQKSKLKSNHEQNTDPANDILPPTRYKPSSSKSIASNFNDEPQVSKDYLSLSIHSPSNYEKSTKTHKAIKTTFPKEWSSILIKGLEWRVFDRLCVSYWRSQGNSIVGIAERAHEGIDFFIGANNDKRSRIAVIQTRSHMSPPPKVDDMRNLVNLQRINKLPIAILMYSCKLSNVAHSYCITNGIRLIDQDMLSKGLLALAEKEQRHLLKSLVRPDYMIPTCPNCLVKLIKRQDKKSGRLFWGCISYPECRFTLGL